MNPTDPDRKPGQPSAAVALDLAREALTQWPAALDADDRDLTAAWVVLESTGTDTTTAGYRAVGLVTETWPTDPPGWPQAARMAPADHLALILAGIDAELIDGEPGDGARLWDLYRSGPYRTAGHAAYAALDGVGALHEITGPDRYPPDSEPHPGLTDRDRTRRQVPDELLESARRVAGNYGHAPVWVDAGRAGWVVFTQA